MKNLLLTAFCFLVYNICLAQDSLHIAYVKTKDNCWQIIDRTGKILADSLFEYDSLAILSCNEGMVITEKNGKYGFLDLFNQAAIDNRFDTVTIFKHGNAAARINRKWYRLARNGTQDKKILSDELIDYYLAPVDNAPACINNYCLTEADSFVNCKAPDGSLLLKTSDVFIAPWNDVNSFISDRILKYKIMANKVCSCQKLTNYYGFIDRNGKWIIEPSFENADIFSCGLAAVSEGTENIYTYGYVGMDGQWVIQPVYKEAGRFIAIGLKS